MKCFKLLSFASRQSCSPSHHPQAAGPKSQLTAASALLPPTPPQGSTEGYLLDTCYMANVVAGVTGDTTQLAQEVIRQLMLE
jgi:hypothetical protein